MSLSCVDEGGARFVEGRPGQPLMVKPEDAARVIEACLSSRVKRALLYPANLPAAFFYLSSGQAGTMLDKLRQFGVRWAVVCAPGSVRFSSRFHEVEAADFRLFETREAAREWLVSDA